MKQRFCRDEKDQLNGLKKLINKLPDNIKLVELGSFAGESTGMFAGKSDVVYAVDIWEQSAEAMSRVAGSTEKASDIEYRFDLVAENHKNIIKIKQRTDVAYKYFEHETLDFVYIDAQHDYAPVKQDIINWISKIKPGGYIGGHDYNQKDFPGVIQAVTEVFGDKVEIFDDTSWLCRVSDEIVTFLMPVFNREHLVGPAIDSLINQSKDNWRLICFDDSSKDNSVAIINQYIEKHGNKISLIIDTTKTGITHGRNTLLKNCKTRLAAWLDSDDVINKYRLELQFPIARRGKNYVLSQAEWFSEDHEVNINEYPKKIYENVWQCPAPCVKGFTCGNSTPSAMFEIQPNIEFKHHYFNCGNSKKQYLVGEDCYFVRRMIEDAKVTPVVLNDVLYNHRDHLERMVKVVVHQAQETDYHELFYKQRISNQHCKRAVVTICNGDFYNFMAEYTHPSIRKYANDCEASFIVLKTSNEKDTYKRWNESCWEKFNIVNLFEKYDEILYVDTDMFIKKGTKNLFNVVPPGHVGMLDEYNYSPVWVDHKYPEYLKQLGLDCNIYYPKKQYYNAGIFLIRKDTQELLTPPIEKHAKENGWATCAEQSYLNINIIRHKIPVYNIGIQYNAFVRDEKDGKIFSVDNKDINIFHLCGIFGIHKQNLTEAKKLLDKWKGFV